MWSRVGGNLSRRTCLDRIRVGQRPPPGVARLLTLALVCLGAVDCVPPRGSTSPATAVPTVEVQTEDRTLRIGTALSLSGRFSREGAILRDGYETWLRAANEVGGIDVGGTRWPIRLTVYDDESEPLMAAKMAEKLVREDGVTLLLGPFSNPITTATATATERLGALTVAPDAGAAPLFARGLELLVSVLPADDRYLHGLLALADGVGPGPQTLGVLVPDEPFFAVAAQGAVERARARGMGPVAVEHVPLDAREVRVPLARLARLGPTLVAVAGAPERLGSFLTQSREIAPGAALRAAVPGPPLREFPSTALRDAEELLTVDWWSPRLRASGPVLGSAAEFAARFERDHGYPPDARAASAAAAGLTLQLGIEAARSAEPRRVRTALATLEVETFWGQLAWDANGRNAAGATVVLQREGGQWIPVYPDRLAERRVRFPRPTPPPPRD